MGEGISDYTKFTVDLRRHMWKSGVEMELRRLIWQIAVMGKYISAKIHESNRKLAGFKNIYGEEQLTLDRSADEILKNQLEYSGFVREYASEERDSVIQVGKGDEKYFITADAGRREKDSGSGRVYHIWPSDNDGLFCGKGNP
jgi:fructose-1,6-bisphosphatase I